MNKKAVQRILVKRLFRVLIVLGFFCLIAQQGFIDGDTRIAKMQNELGIIESQNTEKHEKQEAVYYDKEERDKREQIQYKAILGGLQYVTKEKELDLLKMWHHTAFQMKIKREEKADFQITDEEYNIWKKIRTELDQLTALHLVGDSYDYRPVFNKVDYGEGIIKRLQETITKNDGKKLKKLRDDYFASQQEKELEEDEDNVKKDDNGFHVEYEMRLILEPYEELNTDVIILTLLDDKMMSNKAVYIVEDNLNLRYEETKKNGLGKLTQDEKIKYPEYWEKIKQIIPTELLANFTYFKIGSDGEFGVHAYVIRMDMKGAEWCLNLDPVDYKENGFFPYTIVHEMAHFLSFNNHQVKYYKGDFSPYPSSRFVEYGCVANKNAYIQLYYEQFWEAVTPVWATDPESSYFYNRHKKEYVTPYASTSCAEDFAETFCAYVLMERAPTPETRKKFMLFDQFPEIKQLKLEILKKIMENEILVNPVID